MAGAATKPLTQGDLNLGRGRTSKKRESAAAGLAMEGVGSVRGRWWVRAELGGPWRPCLATAEVSLADFFGRGDGIDNLLRRRRAAPEQVS